MGSDHGSHDLSFLPEVSQHRNVVIRSISADRGTRQTNQVFAAPERGQAFIARHGDMHGDWRHQFGGFGFAFGNLIDALMDWIEKQTAAAPSCDAWNDVSIQQGRTRRCHTAIIDRQATAIIPIRKNGRPWKEDCAAAVARNEILRATRHYGRAFWKRWTGYHVRSRIEAKMRCLKAFGERISATDPDRQTAEIQIRVALMNRFSALGTAEIVRVA